MEEWIEGDGFLVKKDQPSIPPNEKLRTEPSKPKKKVQLGYYDRPYCENCKLIYGKGSMGVVLKCTKCGKPLILKSFNYKPKVIGGIIILILTILSFFIAEIPIIWIGGLFLGVSMISNSLSQWDKIKKIDASKYY